jgi:hypothetical protein
MIERRHFMVLKLVIALLPNAAKLDEIR